MSYSQEIQIAVQIKRDQPLFEGRVGKSKTLSLQEVRDWLMKEKVCQITFMADTGTMQYLQAIPTFGKEHLHNNDNEGLFNHICDAIEANFPMSEEEAKELQQKRMLTLDPEHHAPPETPPPEEKKDEVPETPVPSPVSDEPTPQDPLIQPLESLSLIETHNEDSDSKETLRRRFTNPI